MRGGRERRAIREVLLDLGPEHGIELAQDDPDLAIEHASAQRDHEVERVVARERQQRGRIIDAGGFQGFIRVRRNRPHDPNFVTGRRRQFRVNAFRQGIAANDQYQRTWVHAPPNSTHPDIRTSSEQSIRSDVSFEPFGRRPIGG